MEFNVSLVPRKIFDSSQSICLTLANITFKLHFRHHTTLIVFFVSKSQFTSPTPPVLFLFPSWTPWSRQTYTKPFLSTMK